MTSNPDSPIPRVHLTYLDGLRGIAAVYVSLFHVWQGFTAHIFKYERVLSPIFLAMSWGAFGRTAVGIFIVLSGYVLMLPVVRSSEQNLRGGVAKFFRRRAQRILPSYYAALLIAVLLAVAVTRHVDPSDVFAHLFLLQNLRQVWIYSLDVPMWSVAVECQIYVIFALLLLPIWRKFGIVPTVTTAWILGLLLHFVTHSNFDRSSPWYLGLFAFGMLGAEIGYSQQSRFCVLKNRLPWLPLSSLFVLCFLCIEYAFMILHLRNHGKDFVGMTNTWEMDLLAGLATFCLLVGCTRHLTDCPQKRAPIVLRLLSSPVLVFLGTFSYSYYLIHVLAFTVVRSISSLLHSSILLEEMLQLIVGVPIALLSAYAFFLIVERRSLPRATSNT